jgi:hypothetical protein
LVKGATDTVADGDADNGNLHRRFWEADTKFMVLE